MRILQGLDRHRFEPTVACFVATGPLHATAAETARIELFPLRGHLFDRQGLAQLARYCRMLRSERFDFVHTLSDRANVFGLIGCALTRQRRVVASQRTLDPVTDGFTQASPTLVWLSRMLFRRVTDRITVNNTWIAEHLKRVVRIPAERIRVIENGVDTERFAPRPGDPQLAAELDLPPDHLIVGIVARLTPRKGHRPLLEALERFSPQERPVLIVAGEGPMSDEICAEVGRRGLGESVRRVGFIADPARLYNLFDVFCLPTTFAEGTPTALIEALASGVPSVVSDLPQIRTVVKEGVTGLFVRSDRPEDIVGALRRLCSDGNLRRRLASEGRSLALRCHTLEAMVRNTQAVYEELTSGGEPR